MAVLPFTSIGAGDTYFADGITEAVTTELGRVGGLRVIASNTAFGYRNKTIRDVVRDLGVAHVVTGSVQRAGDNVPIDVRLVNTRDEVASWGEHYSRKLTDALSVQDEISGRIAGSVSQRFRPPSGKPSLATNNPQAYDAYLRGLWHLKGRRADGIDDRVVPGSARRLQAIEELERAVEHDPDFALAHAALASAYTQRFFYDTPDAALEQKGFLHIKSALAINPELAEAHLAHAQLTWNLRHGFPHAEEAYRAVVLALLGQHEDARRMLDDAMPRAENAAGLSHVHHAQFHIGAALGLLGRKDEAVRWLKQAADEGYPSYPRFSTDASLAPLRGHAGFEALVDGLRQRHALWRKTL